MDGEEPLTLKKVILIYLVNAHQMELSQDDLAVLYTLGNTIGASKGRVGMDVKQYDALKRMVDNGKVGSRGERVPIYGILVSQQAKEMVDSAEVKKD